MSRSKFLLAAFVAAAAALVAPATSQAAFKIRFDAGNNNVFETTIEDNQAGDGSPVAGVINSSTSFAGFTVVTNVGTSKPVIGAGKLGLISVEVSGGAGVLAIELTDTDFSPGLGVPYILSVGGTSTATIASQTFEASGTNSNTEFDRSNTTGAIAAVPDGGTSFTAVKELANGGADPYSLTIRAVITHTAAGQVTQFTADLNPQVNAVPAPAGLVMLATVLPFAGLIRRRLRKSELATAA